MAKPKSPSPTTIELTALLIETFSLFHQRAAGDALAVMNDVGLTMPQIVTLFALRRLGPHSVCHIADRLNLSRAATSHLVDRLVQEALVERQEDAGDRRQKRVSIGPRGVALLERLDRARSSEFSELMRKLSPDLQRALCEVLKKMIAELRQDDTGSDPLRMNGTVAVSIAGRGGRGVHHDP
jgi:DNA-binding MarR family transcriptional regulator